MPSKEPRNLNKGQKIKDIQVLCVTGSQVLGCIPSPQELVQHADTRASPAEILIPNSETLRNTHDYSDPSGLEVIGQDALSLLHSLSESSNGCTGTE